MKLLVEQLKEAKQGEINMVYIPKSLLLSREELCLLDNKYAFKFDHIDEKDVILLSKIQRIYLNKVVGKNEVTIKSLNIVECDPIVLLKIDIEVIGLGRYELIESFKNLYQMFPFNNE